LKQFYGFPPAVRLRLAALELSRNDMLKLYETFVMEGEAAAIRSLDMAIREPSRRLNLLERWAYWLLI
jgi:hypothetical protein